MWWTPRRAIWWIAVLFSIGSACFLFASLPGFAELVGSAVDATVYFVGSIFFTCAATLQLVQTPSSDRMGRWSSAIQVAGTIFFNASTFRALQSGLDANEYNRLVWAPDVFGSICFLVSGYIAYVEVSGKPFSRPRRSLEWWIPAINLIGCVAFGIAAIASHVVASTGSARDLARANGFTALGGLCFLVAAVLLLPANDNGQDGQAASPGLDDDPASSARIMA